MDGQRVSLTVLDSIDHGNGFMCRDIVCIEPKDLEAAIRGCSHVDRVIADALVDAKA